ncbi:MAG: hypothetical protein AAF483_05980 [Planctomycetota bacterium]
MAQQTSMSTLQLFVVSGGLPLLGLGFLVSCFALALIIRPNLQGCVLGLCLLTLPGMYAMYSIFSAAAAFRVITTSSATPKPGDVATVFSNAMSSGFCGTLSMLVPTILLAIALLRAVNKEKSQQESRA